MSITLHLRVERACSLSPTDNYKSARGRSRHARGEGSRGDKAEIMMVEVALEEAEMMETVRKKEMVKEAEVVV